MNMMSVRHLDRTKLGDDRPVSTAVVSGFLPGVLERVRKPDTGLAIWRRVTSLHLRASAPTLLSRSAFIVTAAGSPEAVARALCRDLMLFHWPLYADFQRLGRRLASLSGAPAVRMRFEHVIDDSCRKFHVDAVGLRLLCTYAGAGTEWVNNGGHSAPDGDDGGGSV